MLSSLALEFSPCFCLEIVKNIPDIKIPMNTRMPSRLLKALMIPPTIMELIQAIAAQSMNFPLNILKTRGR